MQLAKSRKSRIERSAPVRDRSDGEVRSESPREGAVRTCVACRKPGVRGELFRWVEGPDGEIAVDVKARLPGRGAWVHPTRECIAMAVKRHAAERALKVAVRELDANAILA